MGKTLSNENLTRLVSDLKTQNDSLYANKTNIESSLSDLQDYLTDIQSKCNSLLENLNDVASSNSIESLSSNITDLQTSVTSISQQINNLASASNLANLQSDVTSIISTLGDISSAISSLENMTPDYTNLLNSIREIVRPSGHVNPYEGLYPEFMVPCFLKRYDTTTKYGYLEDISYLNKGITDYIPNTYNGISEDLISFICNFNTSKYQNISFALGGFTLRDYNTTRPSFDLTNWDVSNVKHAKFLTHGSYIEELDLSNWDVRNIRNMSYMFAQGYNPYNSTKANGRLKKLKVTNWNVQNVSDMSYMFMGNPELTELDLSTWDLSYVEKFQSSFYYCSSLNKIIWGGAINSIEVQHDYERTDINTNGVFASLSLGRTAITPENANLFFNSLSPKTISNQVKIAMPTTAQGADISIAENKGYTILGITAP